MPPKSAKAKLSEAIKMAHNSKHFAVPRRNLDLSKNDLEARFAVSADALHEATVDAEHHLRCWHSRRRGILDLGTQLGLDRSADLHQAIAGRGVTEARRPRQERVQDRGHLMIRQVSSKPGLKPKQLRQNSARDES
jgi:hypothetical protein